MEREDDIKKPSRQQLAIDRTHLANERTLLSYFRTSLAMVGFGVLILKFDTGEHAIFYGLATIVAAIAIIVFGIIRYYHFRKSINNDKNYDE